MVDPSANEIRLGNPSRVFQEIEYIRRNRLNQCIAKRKRNDSDRRWNEPSSYHKIHENFITLFRGHRIFDTRKKI